MYASVSCIRVVMMRDGLVFAADKSQGVDAPVASAFGPEQMTLTNTPDPGKHEPEASSVPAVSPVATLSQHYHYNISRGTHSPISNIQLSTLASAA